MDNYIHIIVSTTCVYFFIIVALRILGKTELAQLSVTDLIFVVSNEYKHHSFRRIKKRKNA